MVALVAVLLLAVGGSAVLLLGGPSKQDDREAGATKSQPTTTEPDLPAAPTAKRDANLVLTTTRAEADEAKAAVASGNSWAEVADQYSIDPQTKEKGGEITDLVKGQQDPAFDRAVFAAKPGQLSGPIKTQFGWVVFEVTRVHPK